MTLLWNFRVELPVSLYTFRYRTFVRAGRMSVPKCNVSLRGNFRTVGRALTVFVRRGMN